MKKEIKEVLELIDKNEWLNLRELRNEIAHEYSFNQDEIVDNLNLIYYNKIDELIKIYQKLVLFIETIEKKDI